MKLYDVDWHYEDCSEMKISCLSSLAIQIFVWIIKDEKKLVHILPVL